MKAFAYCDGSGGSPRGSSCAAVLVNPKDGEVIAERARPLPAGTNNIAEYEGLITALELAADHDVRDLEVFSDSQLIVNQVQEIWDIKEPTLLPLRERAWKAGLEFANLKISWVPREKNRRVDALCTETLNTHYPK